MMEEIIILKEVCFSQEEAAQVRCQAVEESYQTIRTKYKESVIRAQDQELHRKISMDC